MKLILCLDCQDIVPILNDEISVECHCGKSGGRRVKDVQDYPGYTEYWGDKVLVLGISNSSFAQAIAKSSKTRESIPFDAFIIGRDAEDVIRVEPPVPVDADSTDDEEQNLYNWDMSISGEELYEDDEDEDDEDEDEDEDDEDDEDSRFEQQDFEGEDEEDWIAQYWDYILDCPDTYMAVDLDSGIILIEEADDKTFYERLEELCEEDPELNLFTLNTTDLVQRIAVGNEK